MTSATLSPPPAPLCQPSNPSHSTPSVIRLLSPFPSIPAVPQDCNRQVATRHFADTQPQRCATGYGPHLDSRGRHRCGLRPLGQELPGRQEAHLSCPEPSHPVGVAKQRLPPEKSPLTGMPGVGLNHSVGQNEFFHLGEAGTCDQCRTIGDLCGNSCRDWRGGVGFECPRWEGRGTGAGHSFNAGALRGRMV